MVDEAQAGGEVENIGLDEERRDDEDRNRISLWPLGSITEKDDLAALGDEFRRGPPGLLVFERPKFACHEWPLLWTST